MHQLREVFRPCFGGRPPLLSQGPPISELVYRAEELRVAATLNMHPDETDAMQGSLADSRDTSVQKKASKSVVLSRSPFCKHGLNNMRLVLQIFSSPVLRHTGQVQPLTRGGRSYLEREKTHVTSMSHNNLANMQ